MRPNFFGDSPNIQPIPLPIMNSSSTRIRLSLALTTAAILLAELTLVRVFDVILAPTTGYMVITSAMFALGLGGVYLYVFPVPREKIPRVLRSLLFAVAAAAPLVLPALNALPFELNLMQGSRKIQGLAWAGMYLTLVAPFFLGGLVLSLLFKTFSEGIHELYLFDLVGAAVGCLLFIPLLPHFGPGGILMVVAALAIFAALLIQPLPRPATALLVVVGITVATVPLTLDDYLEFRGHANKRGNDELIAQGKRDYVRWDPVSKLDVFNTSSTAKLFSLDGGQQGSWMIKFDGNYEKLVRDAADNIDTVYHGRSSVAHYLYHDSQPEVLVIGSAVGNETLAALIFGARHVDAVEMVGAIVEAARNRYAKFNGDLFNHPKVSSIIAEGRTFLRSNDKRYDIIQMFSNHTSSSIASGTSAAGIAYLQTVEAYMEYYAHLSGNGMLQINHHIYPRMLTTAARAWYRSGRHDFWRHALVIEPWRADTLPTLLIKMTPWTQPELDRALAYLNREPNSGADIPAPARPSPRIFHGEPYRVEFGIDVSVLSGLDVMVGTYGQQGLPHRVRAVLKTIDGKPVAVTTVAGETFLDNQPVRIEFEPIKTTPGSRYSLELLSEGPSAATAFSVWLTQDGVPSLQTVPRPSRPSYFVSFSPIDPTENLVKRSWLVGSPDYAEMESLAYRVGPVTDDSPYFAMIRKRASYIPPHRDNHIDRNTAFILNQQLLPFLSSDWLHLFVVGVVSLSFALLFVFAPLLASRLGRARWPGMGTDLIYFSGLGAGFIMVELSMIQLFKKLIGFPTHTFTAVVFSLLISAGVGSGLSKRLRLNDDGRWPFIFIGIIVYGLVFILTYTSVFNFGLGLSLNARIALAVAYIFPLGLFMGMPFPLGIFRLGQHESAGIPWAWAMNGFFTVFGGFAAIILSIAVGFTMVLYLSLLVYALAFACYWRVQQPTAIAARREYQ